MENWYRRKEIGRWEINDWWADTRNKKIAAREVQGRRVLQRPWTQLALSHPHREKHWNGDGFPESKRNARAAALPPLGQAHLRIFQRNFSHRRGSACPGLSCSFRRSRLPEVGYEEYQPLSVVHISWVPCTSLARTTLRRPSPRYFPSILFPPRTPRLSPFVCKGVRFASIVVVSFVFIDFRGFAVLTLVWSSTELLLPPYVFCFCFEIKFSFDLGWISFFFYYYRLEGFFRFFFFLNIFSIALAIEETGGVNLRATGVG